MKYVQLSEAKARLGRLVEEAAAGESFILSTHNKPRARLIGLEPDHLGVCPKVGIAAGTVRIPDDFNDPLPDFEESYYQP